MKDEIPAHRAAMTARSGDTRLIGKDGVRNLDQEARDAAARSAPKKSPPAKTDSDKPKAGSKPASGDS